MRKVQILTATMANLHKIDLSRNDEVFPDLCDMRQRPMSSPRAFDEYF